MTKKNPFWFLLIGIGIFQVFLYFFFILPQGSQLQALSKKLQEKTNELNKYLAKDIPTGNTIAEYKKHRGILEKEYKELVDFYRSKDSDDKGLEKWFVGSPGPGLPPPLDLFKAKYADEFNALRRRCEESGIKITAALATASEEENKVITEWGTTQVPDPQETQPKGKCGFWEAQDVTAANQKTAQKQFWIQEAIVQSLQSANAKGLVAASFVKKEKRAPKKESQTEFERLFEPIEVRFLVYVDYKDTGRIMSALNSSPINFLFRNMKVIKPALREISIENVPGDEKQRWLSSLKKLLGGGTFPKFFPEPIDLGTCPPEKLNKLPTQFEILPEPPVLVEFYYWVLDFKGE